MNQWSADQSHTLAGGVPTFALAMDQHASRMGVGAAAGPSVDGRMADIAWARIHRHYRHAVTTLLRLHAVGVNARFLRGGIDGWKAAGSPLQSKAAGP